MKNLKKRKLNNKGLSLVEILVTVVIIALISAPVINSFMQAIQVNANARTIQNGTSIAQDTAEYFKAVDIESLIALYGGGANKENTLQDWVISNEKDGNTVEISYTENTGVYKFSGIPVKGADGEDFIVDVTLDPSSYDANNLESDKIKVNGILLPSFSSLNRSDGIMLYRQYAGPDETLKDLFKGKLGSNETAILSNIENYKERKNVKKSALIDIDCTYDGGNNYTYDIKLIITYTYGNQATGSQTTVQATKYLEKTFSQGEVKTIYMLCPIFDIYTIGGATDTIHIDFSYTGSAKQVKSDNFIYFYLAEQDMKRIDTSTGIRTDQRQRLNMNNVTISYSTRNDSSQGFNTPYVNMTYTDFMDDMDSENIFFKLYSNVGKSDNDINGEYSLTYNPENESQSIYNMEVSVKLKGKDDIIATFNSAK